MTNPPSRVAELGAGSGWGRFSSRKPLFLRSQGQHTTNLRAAKYYE